MTIGSFHATPLEFYTQAILDGQPYSFSRWGDGEWLCCLGYRGCNRDGHVYFGALAADLKRCFQEGPTYQLGLQPYSYERLNDRIAQWAEKNNINLGQVKWHNSDVFHEASAASQLMPLLVAMRTKPVLLVGPHYLSNVGHLFSVTHHVVIPTTNCYLRIESTRKSIKAWLQARRDSVMVAFSASMCSNVMIHDLYKEFGQQHWLIDFGSVWDPYVGRCSRSYHKTLQVEPALICPAAQYGHTTTGTFRRPGHDFLRGTRRARRTRTVKS